MVKTRDKDELFYLIEVGGFLKELNYRGGKGSRALKLLNTLESFESNHGLEPDSASFI